MPWSRRSARRPGAPGGPLTAGLLLTVACIAFDGLAVTTVMPVAVSELRGLAAYGWTFSAFMLANVVGIVASGQRTDRAGPIDALVAGLSLFAIGLAWGAAAPTMGALIAARTVQGLGAGALSAVVLATVARCYPADRQPRMLAMLSTAWVVPGLVGPGAAGLVADHASWRLVFAGLVPLVAACAGLTLPALRRLPGVQGAVAGAAAPAMRAIGNAVALAAGSALVLLGLQARSLVAAGGALAVGGAVAVPALRRLMPAGTLRARPGLPAAIAAMAMLSVAFFGAETLLPLFLTVFRGQPATIAGLALSAATFTWTAGAWVQARAAGGGSRAALVAAGAALVAAGIAAVAVVLGERAPLLFAPAGWAVVGLGMGIAYTTITLTVIEQAPAGEEGAAAAAMQLANVLGIALGAGVGGAAVALIEAGEIAAGTGFAAAYGLMLAAGIGTLVLSRRLPAAPPGGR